MLIDIYELQRRARNITNVLPDGYRAAVHKSTVSVPGAPPRIDIEKIGFFGLFNRQVAQLTICEDGKLKAHFFDPIYTLIAISTAK